LSNHKIAFNVNNDWRKFNSLFPKMQKMQGYYVILIKMLGVGLDSYFSDQSTSMALKREYPVAVKVVQ